MEHSKYVVVTQGKVVAGFDEVQVSESLAVVLDLSPEEIRTTLISGDIRKIKTANSPQDANRLYKKLRSRGLECGAIPKELYLKMSH